MCTYNINYVNSIKECFSPKSFFFTNFYFFMFQCNEHVEMNKFSVPLDDNNRKSILYY